MPEIPLLRVVKTITDLKALTPSIDQNALLVGKSVVGDGLGGFYRWDETNVTAEDTQFMNVIPANGVVTGRWVRVFQRARALPQGILVTMGEVRTLYSQGVTDASGNLTVNLTEDNTPGGTALFTEIWETSGQPDVSGISDPNDVIVGNGKASANLKQITYNFGRGNNTVIGVLGITIKGFRAAPAGVAVRVVVTGI